jgi:hypothetical protein
MTYRLLFSLLVFGLSANAQNWSTFLNPSRAIDWTSAGFTIPNYTTNCSTQPTLTANSASAAAANTTAIQNALASCDATHNVVNISAGTYYIAGWTYGPQGKQVVRGAGPSSTTVTLTTESCGGSPAAGVCMQGSGGTYDGSDSVLPPSGNQQCLWTGGLSQGSTTITLSSCPGTPPTNHLLILDQANDSSDTGGVYQCDGNVVGCNYEGSLNGNGRIITGKMHSEQQATYVTSVTSLGGGSYSVTISPGVYFNNIRSGQSPGAWWSATVQNDGLENLTLDGTSAPDHNISMYDCYQCWVKNVRSLNAGSAHVFLYQSGSDVIRDSYFYQSQSHASSSYVIESEIASGFLVENNIFQQTTNPIMFGVGTGNVIGYNYSINDETSNLYSLQTPYYSHNAGNSMNLWESNNFIGIWTDDAWGSSANGTLYRNVLHGWQGGGYQTGFIPIQIRTWIRGFNVVGNVLGSPGIQNQYQAYATSSTAGSGGTNAGTGIYEIGWSDTGGGYGTCGNGTNGNPYCDPLVFSTLMRWGNYDTVTAGIKWDSTEASPAAATYINANFTSTYFGSLAHTLPSSLYYNSKPAWWPSAKAWPPVGPDVASGNLGTCSGTYAGYQGTSSAQCTGGTLTGAWASHATSIPAQDCYLNVMGGPPDGSGGVLNFDANTCYATSSTPAVSPTSLGPWTNTRAISQTLTASGFTGTVTWSKLSGTAPTGLSGTCITGTTGTTCTLTGALSAAGSFSFTIQATNGTNTVATPFTITVNAVPSITSSGSLPAGTLGQAYSQALSTSGGTAPLNCSVATGSLPSGLSFSGCTISGTPSASGTFTAIAADANGTVSSASASLSITVTGPVGVTLLSTSYCQPGISWPSTSPYTACNLTTAAPAGSTIIVGFATYNSAGTSSTMTGVTDSNGDTFFQVANARSTSTQSGSGYWDDFWYAPNVPAQVTSVSPKPSQTVNGNLFVWIVSNVNSVNAAGAENATTGTSGTPFGAAVTTTAAATFIATLLHPDINGNPTTVNAPSISDSVVDGMGWAHLITSSAGTYTPQWNQSATTYAGSTVAFSSSSQTAPASPTAPTGTVR